MAVYFISSLSDFHQRHTLNKKYLKLPSKYIKKLKKTQYFIFDIKNELQCTHIYNFLVVMFPYLKL